MEDKDWRLEMSREESRILCAFGWIVAVVISVGALLVLDLLGMLG